MDERLEEILTKERVPFKELLVKDLVLLSEYRDLEIEGDRNVVLLKEIK